MASTWFVKKAGACVNEKLPYARWKAREKKKKLRALPNSRATWLQLASKQRVGGESFSRNCVSRQLISIAKAKEI